MVSSTFVAQEVIKALLVVAVTLFLAPRITARWQLRNKRRELDLATVAQFSSAYAEYKEVWRLWRIAQPQNDAAKRDELLKRAIAAEAKADAIIVKVVVDRVLEPQEKRALGLFRQSYQFLRHRIAEREPMTFDWTTPEYIVFNEYTARVARLIDQGASLEPPSADVAAEQIHEVSRVRIEDWKSELESPHIKALAERATLSRS